MGKKSLALAIILILIFVYLFFTLYNSDLVIKKEIPEGNTFVFQEDLELKVNGETITSQDVEKQYEKIPAASRENLTKDQVLENLVDQKLLLQEAGKKGVTATDEEIDKYLGQVSALSGLDPEQQISRSGYTTEDYKNNVRDMLTVSNLLKRELDLQNIIVSDAEVNSSIEQNKDQFQDIFNERDQQLENLLRSRIQQRLTLEKQQALVDGYVASLRQRAQITPGGGV